MNKKKNYIVFSVITLLVLVATASLCEYSFYLSKEKFEEKVEAKLEVYKQKADDIVSVLSLPDIIHERSFVDELLACKEEIIFFIYVDDALVFWNSNQFVLDDIAAQDTQQWYHVFHSNTEGVYKYYHKKGFDVLAFIPIKSNYPYANDYLKNGVVSHLNISTDYLYVLSFILYVAALIFLSFAYCFVNLNSTSKYKVFVWSSSVVLLLIGVSYFLRTPKVLYTSCFFSEKQYTANQVVVNLLEYSILSLLTLSVVFVIYINRLFVNRFFFLKRVVFYLFLLVFIEVLHAVVLRNNIDLSIASFEDFNVFVVWSWLILFVLALIAILLLQILKRDYQGRFKFSSLLLIDTGFIVLTSSIYSLIHSAFLCNFIILQLLLVGCVYLWIILFKDKNSLAFQSVFVVLIGVYLLFSSLEFSAYKKYIKYKLQAENILINGNADKDPIAELLIEELDKSIKTDKKIKNMHTESVDLDSISSYLQKQYLHVFWNKYDVDIQIIDKYTDETQVYKNFLESTAQKINQTNFYSLPSSLYTMSFIGWFDFNFADGGKLNENDKHIYIFEFYPTKDFRSYSFPNLFANKETDIFKKADISVAQYKKGELSYHDNKVEWKIDTEILDKQKEGFSKVNINRTNYYLFTSSDNQIVIRELSVSSCRSVLFFSVFLLLTFFLLLRIVIWVTSIKVLNQKRTLGFTTKFQFLFILLLIISFIGTLLFSVGYIKDDYEREQIAYMENKKAYIQKSLQEILYWTENLAYVDRQILNNNLQELAYRYQSDINIYDNQGVLQASTQPLVFTQNLISDLVSPEVIFSAKELHYQYESIGELSYLASYTELLNGDYLQLGFVSIPQYFSQTELNQKIDNFIAVIVQIYLIIVLLAVVAVLIIGKKIAAPIDLLVDKMKLMRLDGKNEKLEYSSNDEIGQLVEQYNRTVDELEKSTRLLLATERESAWRTMARQVAHEINNPLTPMKLTIQQLQRTKGMGVDEFNAYFKKSTDLLIEQIDNLSRIASTFSQFAKLPETQFEEFDIVPKLFSVIELFRDNNDNIEITCTIEKEKQLIIGDAEQLSQVFTNIMKNAVQSIPSNVKGKIDVLLEYVKDKIYIKFKDNGIGISFDDQKNIFNPNFTTKSFGTGLGLSISKNIIKNMGGRIYFESEEGVGSVFIIEFNLKK